MNWNCEQGFEGSPPGDWDMLLQLKWLKMASKYLSTVVGNMHERARYINRPVTSSRSLDCLHLVPSLAASHSPSLTNRWTDQQTLTFTYSSPRKCRVFLKTSV